ncbi:MAG TPA: hypothetical protein VE978_21465 [Chitinophagales bacterium]|nr:hypothetical protein [Chitinophagales bacterium]
MKNRTLIFPFTLLILAVLNLVSISSCSSDKDFKIRGTVQTIENGKDGYTATMKDDNGEDFDAVISRVKLGDEYKVLTSGERVELTSDTLHLDNKLRIVVSKINQ